MSKSNQMLLILDILESKAEALNNFYVNHIFCLESIVRELKKDHEFASKVMRKKLKEIKAGIDLLEEVDE